MRCFKRKSIGRIPKVGSTFGSDALALRPWLRPCGAGEAGRFPGNDLPPREQIAHRLRIGPHQDVHAAPVGQLDRAKGHDFEPGRHALPGGQRPSAGAGSIGRRAPSRANSDGKLPGLGLGGLRRPARTLGALALGARGGLRGCLPCRRRGRRRGRRCAFGRSGFGRLRRARGRIDPGAAGLGLRRRARNATEDRNGTQRASDVPGHGVLQHGCEGNAPPVRLGSMPDRL
jgi:hypothetical protein